jgi:hypothetical protein
MLDSLFPLLFQVFMAGEEAVASAASWLGEEPLETESVFAVDGMGEAPFGTIDEAEDWGLILPSTSDRVCSEYENFVFPMYEVVFKDMGFRLPFSNFQREILLWTKLSPTQIHPNSCAFMRAFELLCDYLRILASKNVLFSFFTVQRGADWVSFRQTQKMFEIFAGKVWSFKERFFLVRSKSVAAQDNLLEAARDFGLTIANLTDEEKGLRQQLWAFVQSLPWRVKTDKRGNPLMSADGTPVIDPRLINTYELLTFEDFEDCLGSLYFPFVLGICVGCIIAKTNILVL